MKVSFRKSYSLRTSHMDAMRIASKCVLTLCVRTRAKQQLAGGVYSMSYPNNEASFGKAAATVSSSKGSPVGSPSARRSERSRGSSSTPLCPRIFTATYSSSSLSLRCCQQAALARPGLSLQRQTRSCPCQRSRSESSGSYRRPYRLQ